MNRLPPCLSIGLLTAMHLWLSVQTAAADDSWRHPFQPDKHTVVLYHFDEGSGDEAYDAMGDKALTLRANKHALWGSHKGFGSSARFQRKDDDPNLLLGPVNNDKLHLRGCTKEWTVEAWVKYEGEGGKDTGRTSANICGTDEEGFSLPIGKRGGWSLSLTSRTGRGDLKKGISLFSRVMGSPRGADPNHDTSGELLPYNSGGYTGETAVITDNNWHHVVWQFRYRDQTQFFFLDGKLVRKVQHPIKDSRRIVTNNASDVGVPFMVGGFLHSQDPPFNLNWGTFEGQIDELRISSVMRYPVAQQLAIIRERLPQAGFNLPYNVQLATEASKGDVQWKLTMGKLPTGLKLDESTGRIHGQASQPGESVIFTVEAKDQSGMSDSHRFAITVARPKLLTESLPPAFAGVAWQARLQTEFMRAPLKWTIVRGKLPSGISIRSSSKNDALAVVLAGVPQSENWTPLTFEVTDQNGQSLRRNFVLKVLPRQLSLIKVDKQTVALFDWQGPNGKLIPDRVGDKSHTMTWTNMGGDRRVRWPGRRRQFPQFTGHGEHGFATAAKGPPKLDFKTCDKEWTLEVWVRRGGPLQGFGDFVRGKQRRFRFGHVCGTYDLTKKGVWELYLTDTDSPDGSMTPGIHFFGAKENQALENLNAWQRPDGIVGDRNNAKIDDTEWHHVAWQYDYGTDVHELFLDGRIIWKMKGPDGRKLVNNRTHDSQFSVSTRLTGYSRYGGNFNYLGHGNFFGQIGEIRISNVRRYGEN